MKAFEVRAQTGQTHRQTDVTEHIITAAMAGGNNDVIKIQQLLFK